MGLSAGNTHLSDKVGSSSTELIVNTPQAYSDMIEERRKRVTNGLEDTYGERKSQ